MKTPLTLIFATLLGAGITAGASAPSGSVASGKAVAEQLERYVAPASTPKGAPDWQYLPGGESYAVLSDDCRRITIHSTASGAEESVLFDVANTRESRLPAIEGFSLSPDGSKILVWTGSKAIYRRSTTAEYYTYEVRSRLLRPLSKEVARQRAPLFSPDSRMVAFVDDSNNIRIAKLDYGSEVAVTTDGEVNAVLNGVPDWTYEEEFGTTCSMAWAPDNLTLCYLRYDERDVPVYRLTLYEGACDPKEQYALYPGVMEYKYPVAGKPNSKVSLYSYDVETRKTKEISLPGASVEYIPRIAYGSDEATLVVTTLNRNQNRLEIFRANPKSTVVKSLYVDESKAWIPGAAYSDISYEADAFVVGSLRSGFFKYNAVSYTGSVIAEIGLPDADATAYYGKAADGSRWFQTASPTPMDRSICRLDAKGRLSTVAPAEAAGSASAAFSPGMKYASVSESSIASVPVHTLYKTDGFKKLRVLEDNAEYAAKVAPLTAGISKEFFKIPASGGTPELNAYIVKPAGFDASKKYPVIFSQYSGPGSQSVLNRWSLDWEQYFASQGFVVVSVDPRGTGGRGAEFMQCVYRNLGHYETIDQSASARYVASQSWADASRIGIYGWSYGGYEALMCATQGSATPFAAAVAIAPVTSWRLYDTVYAERFMLTPGQNDEGYDRSAPLSRADALGCPTLIMYGTLDDNVHPANSLEFVSALQGSGLMCDMFVFPNMNHSINYCRARALVWAKMYTYFSDKLK